MGTLFLNSEVLAVQKSANIMNCEAETILAICKPTFVYVDNLLTKSGIGHCEESSLPAFLVQDGAGQLVCDSLYTCEGRIEEKNVAVQSATTSAIQPCQPHVHNPPPCTLINILLLFATMADYAMQESWHTLPDGYKIYTKTWKVCQTIDQGRKSLRLIFPSSAAHIPANCTGPLRPRIF